jgi:hypothetical protein
MDDRAEKRSTVVFILTKGYTMIREFGTLCLAPVILAGVLTYSEALNNVSKKTQDTTGKGEIIEVMTCDKGFGLAGKASTNGLYGIDLQYGLKYQATEKLSVSFIPKAGLSYTDHNVRELPATAQFGIGALGMVRYSDFVVAGELWHLSNAGLHNTADRRNIGLNMIALMAGWVF